MICCQTLIGWGSPNKEGKGSSHGAPLGEDEVALVRERIDWPHAPFEIPAEVMDGWSARASGAEREAAWQQKLADYRGKYPQQCAEFERRVQGELPADWNTVAAAFIDSVNAYAPSIASRKASQNALNGFGPSLPELIGGSADLAPSNLTIWEQSRDVKENPDGNYIYFGVREFAMSAIVNGMTLHGGFRVYGATFLMFSEYARNALRMAALMKIPSIFVYTHDSIGVGEDGPTHQPVEQAATLRMIPNMSVWRPCDAVESAVSWKVALERKDGPTSLLFSRQNLDHQSRDAQQIASIEKGGYVLRDSENPAAIIIATGSEVGIAVEAHEQLKSEGVSTRVVSMPATDVFDRQPASYREQVLPRSLVARVAVEAGVSDGWYKYVGIDGAMVCLDGFGESGPASKVFEHFGFHAAKVAESVRKLL